MQARGLGRTRDELCEEARLRAEDLLAVAHSPPQHPPQHVAAPLRRGQRAVGDGKGQRACMVGDDAVRRVLSGDRSGEGGGGQGLREGSSGKRCTSGCSGVCARKVCRGSFSKSGMRGADENNANIVLPLHGYLEICVVGPDPPAVLCDPELLRDGRQQRS